MKKQIEGPTSDAFWRGNNAERQRSNVKDRCLIIYMVLINRHPDYSEQAAA